MNEKIKKEVFKKVFNIVGSEEVKNYRDFRSYLEEIFERVDVNLDIVEKIIDETIETSNDF